MRDIRSAPFCWQDKNTLRLLKKTFEGTERAKILAMYTALTWIASDQSGGASNPEEIYEYTDMIEDYTGLDPHFIKSAILKFEELGILTRYREKREDGKFGRWLVRLGDPKGMESKKEGSSGTSDTGIPATEENGSTSPISPQGGIHPTVSPAVGTEAPKTSERNPLCGSRTQLDINKLIQEINTRIQEYLIPEELTSPSSKIQKIRKPKPERQESQSSLLPVSAFSPFPLSEIVRAKISAAGMTPEQIEEFEEYWQEANTKGKQRWQWEKAFDPVRRAKRRLADLAKYATEKKAPQVSKTNQLYQSNEEDMEGMMEKLTLEQKAVFKELTTCFRRINIEYPAGRAISFVRKYPVEHVRKAVKRFGSLQGATFFQWMQLVRPPEDAGRKEGFASGLSPLRSLLGGGGMPAGA